MTLQVEIQEKNKEQIISAIRLLRGVKAVQENQNTKATKTIKTTKAIKATKPREFTEVVETKADYKAWLKAREDLARGDVIDFEELKRKYGYGI